MASEIAGLFTTPEQYQLAQQRAQEAQALQYAQQDPRAQAQYGFFRGGQQLGTAIGNALGIEDPQLKIISRRQSLASQLDPSNPQSYMQVAKLAADAGDQQFALAVADAGRKAQADIALVQQRTAEKMTGEQRNSLAYADSVATRGTPEWNEAFQSKFEQLTTKAETISNEQKNAASLADSKGLKRGTPEWNTEYQAQLTRLTTKELKPNIKDVGVADKTREVVYFDENTNEQFVMKPSQTDPTKLVRVPYSGGIDKTTAKVSASASSQGETAFTKQLGELDAKKVASVIDARDNAIGTLNSLNRLNELNQQDLISGTFATGRVGATNFLSTLGLASGKDIDRLSASENYQKTAGDVILATLGGKLGAGFSNDDRKFIQALVPQLENSPQARKQLIEFMVKKNNSIVEEATRLETYAREKNSLKGYVPKVPIVNLSLGSNKPVSQMTREELLNEKARLTGK